MVWVQTLKAEGAGAMHRLEHNVPLGDSGDVADTCGMGDAVQRPVSAGRPAHDLARHAGTEAGAVLARVLAEAGGAPLVERYATEVQRTRRTLRQGGALIELALDEGHILAGDASGAVSCAICEIEFELLSGPPQALLALASRWVDRFGLVLDVRSKSERGHRLATGQATSAPTRARPLTLSARTGLDAVLAATPVCWRHLATSPPPPKKPPCWRRRQTRPCRTPNCCTSCGSACAGCAPC